MSALRRLAPRGAIGGWLAFGLGVALMLVATGVYGDWYLIRRPWSDIGLGLIVWGLAIAALASIVISSWPIRWLTLSALPGIAATAFFWAVALTMPLSGACCDQPPFPRDPGTILYSVPLLIPSLAVSTAAILLPLLIAGAARPVRRR